MGVKNTVFFLDLKLLDKKVDDDLKEFAKSEELEVEDVVKIIYNEANRIGEKEKVKVTFKIVDGDSFRVIVESANVKYKGTIIYPYETIKSDNFEFKLDSVCGKITLYNKKKECSKMSLTIENVALDIFAMTYNKASKLLKDISDRKQKNGYLEFPDSICFRDFGVKLNAQKSESGDVKVDELVASIDVFNKEEFLKEYYFEEIVEEKYDVNIPLPDEYNYEKKDKKNIVEEQPKNEEKQEIEIELPVEKVETQEEIEEKKKEEDRLRQEELEQIRKRQDEELERVKNKLKRELEEELNKNIKKYDEENEKRLNEELEDKKEEIETEVNVEITEDSEEITKEEQDIIEVESENKVEENEIVSVPMHDREEIQLELKNKIENAPEIEVDIDSFEINDIEEKNAKEEVKIETEQIKVKEEKKELVSIDEEIEEKVETDTKEEIVEEIQEELSQNEKEILELERLLEEEKKQQEALEKRIKSKLEELKTVVKENKKVEKKEVKEEKKVNKELNVENTINYSNEIKRIKFDEPIKIKDPDGFRSYTIESYVGIQEQGRNVPSVYFGQSKERVRRYFGGAPKEVREYDEMELYDIFYAYYDEEDKCTGIGIYNQEIYKDKIALYMFGQNLITMKYRDIVKLIKKNDYNAIEDDDGIISLKYGISVDPKESSNYKDEISDVIHIFKKGYYDEVYENF